MFNQIYTVKNTHELQEGDVILCHGAYLVLTDRKAWGLRSDDCPVTQGECITLLGFEVARKANAVMPKHWTKEGYSIQGNKLAMWCVVTAEPCHESGEFDPFLDADGNQWEGINH